MQGNHQHYDLCSVFVFGAIMLTLEHAAIVEEMKLHLHRYRNPLWKY